MKILVIGNFSDVNCGFMNFSNQTVIALLHAGHEVGVFDGTYSQVYDRHQRGVDGFLPEDAASYDVIHVIWHPATLNHYSGARWPIGWQIRDERTTKKPVLSVWNGCPAAWCPFTEAMDIRWGVLGREPEHHQIFYPIPDWIDLQHDETSLEFIVGYSGVRGDGLALLTEVCDKNGWEPNFSVKGVWYSIEEEIKRLAWSTVNVGWYGAEHDDRSGSAMMCLASRRPFLCNRVPMFTHVLPYVDRSEIYTGEDLEDSLQTVRRDWLNRSLKYPYQILKDYSWSKACRILEAGWQEVKERR